MLYGISRYVPGYEPSIHDVQDDRLAIFSVWKKGGKYFIKVSITYQTMPALLKRLAVMVPFIDVLSLTIGNKPFSVCLL